MSRTQSTTFFLFYRPVEWAAWREAMGWFPRKRRHSPRCVRPCSSDSARNVRPMCGTENNDSSSTHWAVREGFFFNLVASRRR
jgi:hypothetical protein